MTILEVLFIISVFYIAFAVCTAFAYLSDRFIIKPVLGRTLLPEDYWK